MSGRRKAIENYERRTLESRSAAGWHQGTQTRDAETDSPQPYLEAEDLDAVDGVRQAWRDVAIAAKRWSRIRVISILSGRARVQPDGWESGRSSYGSMLDLIESQVEQKEEIRNREEERRNEERSE